MAAFRKHPSAIPEDAVIMSLDQALSHQMEFISDWEKTSEVWPLTSGVAILSIAASAAGIYINGHYRRKLKLRRIGFMTTYIPIVVLPGMVAAVLHKSYITYDILLERTKCPTCLQARSAAFQAAIGFLYPLILAPLGNFMYATRHGTYRLPDLTTDYFGSGRLLVKFARPIGTQLSVILIGQILLGSFYPYLEGRSYHTVKQRMIELENEYENSRMNNEYDEN